MPASITIRDRGVNPYRVRRLTADPIEWGMDFKDRLRQLREWRELTQDQLGDMAGLGQSTIGNYEAGTRFPKLNTQLPALAAALGVPVHELFTETPPDQIGNVPRSQSLRLDADMLLTANRETIAFLDIEYQGAPHEAPEARWAEIMATVYPLVAAGGGDLRREDARALTRASVERANARGEHGERSRRKRGRGERNAIPGNPAAGG